MVINGSLRNSLRFKLCGYSFLSFLNGKSRELLGVYELIALAEICSLFKRLFGNVNVTELFVTVDYLNHIDIMSNSILKVTLIVRRNSHYSSRSVICQNEITDKHSDFLTVNGVYAGNSLKLTARLGLIELGSVHIVLLESLIDISLNLFLILNAGHKMLYGLSIGSKHHKGDTVNSLYAGREYRELSAANDVELDLNSR